ncbi:MAG: hypothetical protein ACK4YD_01545 [Chitinophagia bacterium]|jgi:hypothetical protein
MLKKNHIQEEIQLISPAVANLSNTTPFAVPEDYFEQFPVKILQKIAQISDNEEISIELSPLLQSLKEQNPFQVPVNYFHGIAVNVPKQDHQVVSMFSWKKWMGYAAAACFIGIMGILLYFNGLDTPDGTMAKQNSTLVDQQVTTESMQTYLTEVDVITETINYSTELASESNLLVEMTPQVISEILKEIPENDISSYISQTEGSEMEMLN